MAENEISISHFDPTSSEIRQRKHSIGLIASSPVIRSILGAQLSHEGLALHFLDTLLDGVSEDWVLPAGLFEPPALLLLEQSASYEETCQRIFLIQSIPFFSGCPIVMVSEDRRYGLFMRSITNGAVDYILLPTNRRRLAAHLSRLLGLDRYRSIYDAGRFVRNFHRTIDKEIKRSSRARAPFGLMFAHLQFGEDIPLGEAQEEDPLVEEIDRELGALFSGYLDEVGNLLRETDMIAPLGEREMLMVLPFTTKEGLGMVRDKLEGAFTKVVNSRKNHLSLSLKLGGATYPDDSEDRIKLLERAEEMTEA